MSGRDDVIAINSIAHRHYRNQLRRCQLMDTEGKSDVLGEAGVYAASDKLVEQVALTGMDSLHAHSADSADIHIYLMDFSDSLHSCLIGAC